MNETMSKQNKRRAALIILWITAICLASYAVYATFIDRGYTEVCFLDVGQGDSCFIMTDSRNSILIDGGDDGSGTYIIKPFLVQKFAKQLDAVFISHLHADHIKGITELLEQNFPIRTVYISDASADSDKYADFLSIAKKHGTDVKELSSGSVVDIDNVKFTVAASGFDGDAENDENARSMLLRFDCGENSILFTGDAPRKEERQLLGNPIIDTDFLKVGHHGSHTSSDSEFLREVSPELSIISVGENNMYNHPSPQTLKTFTELDMPVMRTDYCGTVTIVMTGNDIRNISGSRVLK